MYIFVYLFDASMHQNQCDGDNFLAGDETETTLLLDESSDEETIEEYRNVDIEEVLRNFDQDDIVQEETHDLTDLI